MRHDVCDGEHMLRRVGHMLARVLQCTRGRPRNGAGSLAEAPRRPRCAPRRRTLGRTPLGRQPIRTLAVSAVLGAVAVICLSIAACLVPSLTGSAAAATYRPYFGNLHGHTGLSDGSGTPAQAFAAAKAAGADFLAVTDHTTMLSAADWTQTRSAARAATSARFAGLAGFEVTATWGHANVYGSATLPSGGVFAWGTGSPATLYDWLLAHRGAVGQWNHPSRIGSNDFDRFAYLTPQRRRVMCALEVVNRIFTFEPSYVAALDRGWRVMPTAGADTHDASWISGSPDRTVLLAERLTPAALLSALRARRGYATTNSDLRVRFLVDGEVMGRTLVRPGKVRCLINVKDPAPQPAYDRLRRLEIVSDGGRVVARLRCKTHAVAWRPRIDASRAHYFYLRISDEDGPAAWTAPVWTGR